MLGDSGEEEEPYFQAKQDSNPQLSDDENLHTPSASTDNSSEQHLSMLTGCSDSVSHLSWTRSHRTRSLIQLLD